MLDTKSKRRRLQLREQQTNNCNVQIRDGRLFEGVSEIFVVDDSLLFSKNSARFEVKERQGKREHDFVQNIF